MSARVSSPSPGRDPRPAQLQAGLEQPVGLVHAAVHLGQPAGGAGVVAGQRDRAGQLALPEAGEAVGVVLAQQGQRLGQRGPRRLHQALHQGHHPPEAGPGAGQPRRPLGHGRAVALVGELTGLAQLARRHQDPATGPTERGLPPGRVLPPPAPDRQRTLGDGHRLPEPAQRTAGDHGGGRRTDHRHREGGRALDHRGGDRQRLAAAPVEQQDHGLHGGDVVPLGLVGGRTRGVVEDLPGLGGARQAPVQVGRAGDRPAGVLPVAVRRRLAGQHRDRLHVPALLPERVGEELPGGLAAAGVAGGAGQALAQLQVEAADGLAGGGQEHLRPCRRPGLHLPGGHPQQVVAAAQVLAAERLGQHAEDRPRPGHRKGGPQHLPVQGVGQAYPRPPPGPFHHQQPGALGGLDGGAVGQELQHHQRQRLPAGGQLDGGALGRPQPVQAGADQLGEAGGAAQATRPAPHLAGAVQGARLQPPEDQLAQEQRVAFGHVNELVARDRVDLAVQGAIQQPLHRLAAQRLHGHPPGQAVLPQRHDRVGGGLAAAHGGHHHRQRAGHELVDQRGRGVVEQVRVVHAQHQPLRPGAPGELVGRPAEHLPALGTDALGGGQQVRDRPEGDGGGRAGGGHPGGLPAGAARLGQRLASQSRLADPGRPGEHHPAGGGVEQVAFERLQLAPTANEWPCHIHSADPSAGDGARDGANSLRALSSGWE
jgi:hypothetical protein